MNEAVVAILLISLTLAASVFIFHQLQGAEALRVQDAVVLERVTQLNQTHSIYYVLHGCLEAFNLSLAPGLYCQGDLVVLSVEEAVRYLP